MFLTRRRIILMLAVVAVAGAIIVLPYISSLTATGLDRVTIELFDVEPVPPSEGEKNRQIDVVFRLTNPTDKTVTTSKIEYDLFADNSQLGNAILSFEDIPLMEDRQFCLINLLIYHHYFSRPHLNQHRLFLINLQIVPRILIGRFKV